MSVQLSAICEVVDDQVPLQAVSIPMEPVGIGTGSGDVFIVAKGRLVVDTPRLFLPVQLGTARASTIAWGLLCGWGIAKSTCLVWDPYRVDVTPIDGLSSDSELLLTRHRGCIGTDMKWY